MPNKKRKHLIAVYGTLRKGLHNHHLIQTAPQVMTVMLRGFRMKSLGAFPIVEFAGEESLITAEVYHLTDAELQQCDALEGHPNWYERTEVGSVKLQGDEKLQMYIMPHGEYPDAPVVGGGDWIKYTEEKQDA